jgi:hypothetical protein
LTILLTKAEFELQVKPKPNIEMDIPDGRPVTQCRRLNMAILEAIAQTLRTAGLDATMHDLSDDDKVINYTHWNVVLDGSLSKAHMSDGFYPVEIITPLILADETWPGVINCMWEPSLRI